MKSLLVAFAVLTLLSCDTDVTQDYTIPYAEHLVLESFISPQDTLIQVRVMKTAPSIGKKIGQTGLISDARVELSNGTRTVTLPFVTDTGTQLNGNGVGRLRGYQLKTSEFPIEAGRTYTLRASVPSGLSAQARCTVPTRNVDPSQVDIKRGTTSQDGRPRPTIQVRVKDVVGMTNRYFVTIFRINEHKNNLGKLIQNRYPAQTDYLSDNNRDGDWLSSQKISLYVNTNERFELFVATTDIPYYEYNTTIQKHQDAQGNPFAEPQPVYSNVSGGLGVFAAYQWVRLPLVF